MTTKVESIERRTVRKVFWRLMPLLILGSAMGYIDRVNIGFASLTMNADLGLTAGAYGIAAGAFYLTYSLFEVPSNMLMAKVGPRRWLARIMISWGVISAATIFVTGPNSLIFLRMLLGLAEAGFTPGVLVFLTWWFPRAYRGRMVALFLGAQVVGVILGSSVSGPLLELDLWGLAGWQWMFIIEGLPTTIGGILLLIHLTERPQEAHWLTDGERGWLQAMLAQERAAVDAAAPAGLWPILSSPRLVLLTLAYFTSITCSLGFIFFLPQIIRSTGLSLGATGLATAFAWCCAGLGMFAWGWWADHTRYREAPAAAACLTFAVGFAGMALFEGSLWVLPMICMTAIGTKALLSAFWTIPTAFLTTATATVVIAAVNTIGNLGGLVGPAAYGWVRDNTAGFAVGLGGSAVLGVAAALMILGSSRLGKGGRASLAAPAAGP